jgi:hypothetical protein
MSPFSRPDEAKQTIEHLSLTLLRPCAMNNPLTISARLVAALVLALLVAGCMVGPDDQPPEATAPPA